MTTKDSHPLQYTWTVWEHQKLTKADDYKNSMREVFDFSTVEEYWRNWNYLPKPSEVFSDSQSRKEINGKTIDSFSVFKKGIRPEWEDPANKNGCDILTTKNIFNGVDIYWENLVLGLIGELLEDGDDICGGRVVEKKKGQQNKPSYRLEIWLRSSSIDIAEKVKSKISDVINADTGRIKSPQPEFEIRLRSN
eukprot:gene20314-26368_t